MLWKVIKSMFRILLIFVILSIGCSSFIPKSSEVSSSLVPYLVEFVVASNGKVGIDDIKELTLIMAEYDPSLDNVLGTCYYLTNTVTIHAGNWELLSELERRALIFHELGHCVLKRDHTERHHDNAWDTKMFDLGILKEVPRLEDNCPGSIMNPVIVDNICLEKHYDYYMDELFNH